MDDLSDTESESSVSAGGWDATDFMQMATELGRICETPVDSVNLRDALDILRGLDICAVERDEQLHETIQQVSNALLSFLDSVGGTADQSNNNLEEIRANLSAILNESNLVLLLEYRTLFRTIASRSLADSTTAIAVCWVDVVLAKLGQAIVNASGILYGVRPLNQDCPEAVRVQIADDMLRAAVQLPETWLGIQQLLCSEHASPAAGRLALCLVWGTTVMAAQLVESERPVHMEGLLKVLEQRLKQHGRKTACGLDMYVSENERLVYAMLVSLYAFIDTTGVHCAGLGGGPQRHAVLLDFVRVVLHSEAESSPLSVYPATELDIPRTVLMKWGCTVPWSWRTWNDPRIHQSEQAETLTSTWLYHLEVSAADISSGHSVEWWDEDLVHALEIDSSTALSMTSRLLHAVLVAEDNAVVLLDDAVLDVVLKVCWSIKHILQAAEISDEALCPLYKILYKIFVGMGVGELDLAVKDLIIEGLSLSPGSFRLALAAFEDPHLEQVQEWRQKLGYMIKYATAKTLNGSSTLELRNIRQTLQLFTLVWSVGCTAGVLSESRLLLSSLLDWLESEPLDSLEWEMLGDATIGALAMSPHLAGSSEPHLGDDFLWDFFREIDPTDLPFAASLSAYVATTVASGSKGSLAYAEAWDYFRDVVLLIFNHEFAGAEEPLALLVCPSICRALMALLQHAPPAAKRYMSASPWTGCMAMNMISLKEGQPEDTDEYNTILCELLGSSVEVMRRELGEISPFTAATEHEVETGPLPRKEPTVCWCQSRVCLIPA